MNIDFSTLKPKEVYRILASLVTPRPIAWISSISKDGVTNLAPFSFFNVMGVRPPIVAFAPGNKSSGEPKDTAQNIIDTGEFIVNLVDESLMSPMVKSAQAHDADTSEINLLGLSTTPSLHISPPFLTDAPISLECKLEQIVTIGQNRLVIGRVLHLHALDGILDPEKFDFIPDSFFPIGRMASPDVYCRSSDQFTCS